MKIILVKLVSGEEVIGTLISSNDAAIVLSKPRVLVTRNFDNGQMGVAMIPFMLGVPDGEHIIYLDKIMGEPNGKALPKQLEDGYIQQTTSIQLSK